MARMEIRRYTGGQLMMTLTVDGSKRSFPVSGVRLGDAYWGSGEGPLLEADYDSQWSFVDEREIQSEEVRDEA